jgi:hypothetical protein
MKTLALLLSMILVGCASVGKNFNADNVAKIQTGKTTEADLVQMFGEPQQRGLKTGGLKTLTWIYTESRVKGETFIPIAGAFMGGADTKTKSLTVSLGSDGTVTDYAFSGGALGSTGTTQADPEQKK